MTFHVRFALSFDILVSNLAHDSIAIGLNLEPPDSMKSGSTERLSWGCLLTLSCKRKFETHIQTTLTKQAALIGIERI